MGIVIRQSIKGTIVNYIGSFLGFLITFFVMTKFLTTEELGLREVLVNVGILLAGLAQMGTGSSILRFYPYFKDSENKDHGFFFWTLVVPFIGFIIFGLLFYFLRGTVATQFSEKSPLFVDYYRFIFPLAFFMLYMSVFESNANVLLRIVVPKFVREIGLRIFALATYLLYAFKIINLDGFIITFCAGYGIATVLDIIYLFFLKRISLKPDIQFITKALRRDFFFYTLFMIATALTTAMIPLLNSIFISKDLGLHFTGIFAVATYIAAIIEIPYRSLGAITQPHISQAIKDANILEANRLSKNISLHQLLVGSFIFFLIWINIDLFFQLLPQGEIYSAGKYVVLFLGFFRLINSSLSVGTTLLNYSKYYYFSLIFTLILSFSAIFLNVKLIPIFGMEGAALASMLSYLFYYFLLLLFVRWKINASPFSWQQLKVVGIIGGLLLLNELLIRWAAPLTISLFDNQLVAQIVESVIRSLFLFVIGWTVVCRWNVSKEMTQITQKICSWVLKVLKIRQ